jgi:hypothetical protein
MGLCKLLASLPLGLTSSNVFLILILIM